LERKKFASFKRLEIDDVSAENISQNEEIAVNDVLTPTVQSVDIEEIATSTNEKPVVQTEENTMESPAVKPNYEDSKDSENQSILEASATIPEEMYENCILESVVLENMDEADDEDSNNEY